MSKPDGKIQGVDVWVRPHGHCDWYISNYFDYTRESKWLCTDGIVRDGGQPHMPTKFFPSRDDALSHLRELEAKERPVVDLTTAKFGDKFKRDDGRIEKYACPQDGVPGFHVMQSGACYKSPSMHLAPYVEPRKIERWVSVYMRGDSSPSCFVHDTEELALDHAQSRKPQPLEHKLFAAPKRIEFVEGEGLTEKT